MKRGWWLTVLLALASLAAMAAAPHPTRLIVASNVDNRPYEYVDENGRPAGFTNDLFRAVAKAQGFEVEIRPMIFSEMMRAFEANEVDAISSVVYTEARTATMDFTAPHSYLTYTILTRIGDDRIRSEQDFPGREVMLLGRSWVADFFSARQLPYRTMPSYEACIQALVRGEGDCTIVPKFTWLAHAQAYSVRNLRMVPGELYPAKRCVAVHRGDRELLARLNEGLLLLKQNGRMDELYARHLGALEAGDLPMPLVLRRTMGTLVPVLLALALAAVLVWTFALRRLVRLRTAALQVKNQQLKELIEDKNQFMGIAAHDLRNPLNSVLLMARFIRDEPGDPEHVQGSAALIETSARQMTEIITSLLHLNQLESGGLNLSMGPLDLGTLLHEVAQAFGDSAKAKGLRIELELPPTPLLVLADLLYLRSTLDNLTSNALKFMSPGPPEKRVCLRAYSEADSVIIEVEDQGPGFTAADLRKVFGRFVRLSARPTSEEASTGLGLSIAKKMVEAMGGTIQLKSEAGKGALFRIRLAKP